MFEIVPALRAYEYVDTYATKKAEDIPVDTARRPDACRSSPDARVA